MRSYKSGVQGHIGIDLILLHALCPETLTASSYINSAPWLTNRFHGKAVMEGQRKFMGTLWNTYAFFVLYANIDNFDATSWLESGVPQRGQYGTILNPL